MKYIYFIVLFATIIAIAKCFSKEANKGYCLMKQDKNPNCSDTMFNGKYQLRKWEIAHYFNYTSNPETFIGKNLVFSNNGCISIGNEMVCDLRYRASADTFWKKDITTSKWAMIYHKLENIGWNKNYFDSGYHIYPVDSSCKSDVGKRQYMKENANSFFVGGDYFIQIINQDSIIFTNGFADYLAVKN